MHVILFDSFFEPGSIQHHRDDMKHFAGVLGAHPKHINRKKKFTQTLQVHRVKVKTQITVSGYNSK